MVWELHCAIYLFILVVVLCIIFLRNVRERKENWGKVVKMCFFLVFD